VTEPAVAARFNPAVQPLPAAGRTRLRARLPAEASEQPPVAPAAPKPAEAASSDEGRPVRERAEPGELLARAERSFDLGDVAQALAEARAAAKAGGGERAHLIAGKALLAEGNLADAEAELAQAVRLAPADPDAATLLERVRARRARRASP
jgi:Flp pilus assembly protein TadD